MRETLGRRGRISTSTNGLKQKKMSPRLSTLFFILKRYFKIVKWLPHLLLTLYGLNSGLFAKTLGLCQTEFLFAVTASTSFTTARRPTRAIYRARVRQYVTLHLYCKQRRYDMKNILLLLLLLLQWHGGADDLSEWYYPDIGLYGAVWQRQPAFTTSTVSAPWQTTHIELAFI